MSDDQTPPPGTPPGTPSGPPSGSVPPPPGGHQPPPPPPAGAQPPPPPGFTPGVAPVGAVPQQGAPVAPVSDYVTMSPEPEKSGNGKTAAIVGGVVVGALALAGGIFALTRSDDTDTARQVDTTIAATIAPDDTTVETTPLAAPPPDTEPTPATTVAEVATTVAEVPTTVALPPTTITALPDTTQPPETTPPATGDLTTIGSLVAWTSFSADTLDEAARQTMIDDLIVSRTVVAVASPTAVSTICAGIPVDAPIDFTVIWQYEGETVQSEDQQAVPPGIGSCIDNGGSSLAAGSYQVLATGDDEIGFATTFVIGAAEVPQVFENNSIFDICDLGVSPPTTGFYELFSSTNGPIKPGEQINIDVASIEQELRVTTCDGENLESLTFQPDAFTPQNMVP